ncbi:MAG: membrane bound O-acyl transferase family-domain-containing protein [Planctomycetes bacterium]|nr:membrane bound O-acyl transferase family-domain-containing protein [Planctomycetota bacterium]
MIDAMHESPSQSPIVEKGSILTASWPLFVLPAAVIAGLFHRVDPWQFMWGLAIAIYLGCKRISVWKAGLARAPLRRRLLYFLVWPGMDARAFLHTQVGNDRGLTAGSWALAAAKTMLGFVLVFVVVRRLPTDAHLVRGWVGMIGLIFVLHFGVFDLLSLALRSQGIAARPLMMNPIASTSVGEFWGRRWNTAFRDLTHRFLFRPLTRRFNARAALAVGFLVSGLAHDLVISLPARGGYGGPTLFFVIQGAALLFERSAVGRSFGLGRGLRGWLFTVGSLVLPAGLLFHRPFIETVMLPFFAAIGASA